MGAERADRSTLRLLAVITGALVVLHLALSAGVTGPWVVPDEAGYLGNARWIIGERGWTMPRSPYYSAGYSTLVAPIMAITDDPRLQWRSIVAVNALLLAAVAPLGFIVLRRIFDLPARAALLAASIGALAPAVLAAGLSGASENLAFPLVLGGALALWLCADPSRPLPARIWFGPIVAALGFTHPRFTLVVGVALILLLGAGIARWVPPMVAVVNTAGLLAGTLAARLLNARLAAGRWVAVDSPEGGVDEWWDLVSTRAGFGELVATAAGQAWYLLAGSLGLAAIGVAITLGRVAKLPKPRLAGQQAATWLPVAFLTASAGAVFATSVLFFTQNQFRLDHYVYGRHNDSFAPLWIALAIGWLTTEPSVARRLRAIVAGGAGVLATGMWVAAVRDPSDFSGRISTFSAPAILALMKIHPPNAFVVTTALSLAGVAILIALTATERLRIGSVRWPAVGQAALLTALALWFAALGIDTSRRAVGYDHIQYRGWHAPSDLRRLDLDEVSVDVSVAGAIPMLTYPFFTPEVRFSPYDSRFEEPSAPAALAAAGDATRLAAGDRIALLDQRYSYFIKDLDEPLALWVAPGPVQDRLAEAGALLPGAIGEPLPPAARSAELTLRTNGDQVISVTSGGRVPVDVEVTHTGSDAPWPDASGNTGVGHVKVVALITPLDPGGIEGARSGGELNSWMVPGDRAELEVGINAVGDFFTPLPPGRYRVELALSQDGHEWLTRGGPNATFTLEVLAES